jgi:uncharacterized protein YjbI with pentapeptide repeats
MNLPVKNFLRNNSVLFSCTGFALLVVGIPVWTIQQRNVDILEGKIQEINLELKSVRLDGLERLKLKKDILVIDKDKTIILNGIGATIAQALGAVVLGATAYVGYQNFKVGADNLKINEESLRVLKEKQVTEHLNNKENLRVLEEKQVTEQLNNKENLRILEEKQVTERFSKAIEHLGNTETEIRLGGIYALEQIAKYSPEQYHWTIVEILSAFIREKCSISVNKAEPSNESSDTTIEKVQVDIQAALTVLGRRKIEQDPKDKTIDLRQVNISGVELQESNFRGINLIGSILKNADFSTADLSHANFLSVNLIGSTLNNANFSNTNLRNADISYSVLKDANLSYTDLRNANISCADLNQANFSYAQLADAKLFDADLYSTNFIGAIFRNTDLKRANLGNADLKGVNLIGCKNLTREQIASATTDGNTEWPDYLKRSSET